MRGKGGQVDPIRSPDRGEDRQREVEKQSTFLCFYINFILKSLFKVFPNPVSGFITNVRSVRLVLSLVIRVMLKKKKLINNKNVENT